MTSLNTKDSGPRIARLTLGDQIDGRADEHDRVERLRVIWSLRFVRRRWFNGGFRLVSRWYVATKRHRGP